MSFKTQINTPDNRGNEFAFMRQRSGWLRFSRSSRQGAAVIEFAVVAPLFLLLLGGIIEFGQAFRTEHTLSNACRRGARAAVVQGATVSQVHQKVKSQCAESLGVSEGDIAIQITVNGVAASDLSQAQQGAEIEVTVSIPYNKVCVGFFAKLFSQSTLSSTCVLEHE
jgi:Flp pilus assembly protein TadG